MIHKVEDHNEIVYNKGYVCYIAHKDAGASYKRLLAQDGKMNKGRNFLFWMVSSINTLFQETIRKDGFHMKKLLSIILSVCLMLSLLSVSLAADSSTEYKTDVFTVTLPAGTWYEKAGAGGLTYYYQNESYNATDGMIMFLAQDVDLGGIDIPESLIGSMYDSLISGLTSSAVGGKVEQDDCKMAGRLSRYFAYDQAVGGSVYPVTGACVMIEGHVLAVCYSYPGKTTGELKETVLEMCATVKYAGDDDGSAVAVEATESSAEQVAETAEGKPILFRGAQWGSAYDEVLKVLPEGVKMYDLRNSEYWYPMNDMMYDEGGWGNQIKGEIGAYTYSKSSSLSGVKVAGYEIDSLYLYFIYVPDENGDLIKDAKHTAFIQGVYLIEPKDLDAAYADIVDKLTKLYGDIDRTETHDSVIVRHLSQWNGPDGTMVSVMSEEYSSGSKKLYIKYGYAGADGLMKIAYDALVKEESESAANSMDGL